MLSATIERATSYFAGIRNHSLKSNGFSFDYLEGGSGRPVLFLHGLAANKSTWLPAMMQLMKRNHVIALDVPAIAIVKQLPNKRGGLHHLSEWLRTFIEAKRLNDIQLIGHSLSAALASYYAARGTGDISSLTMMSIPQWYSSPQMQSPVFFTLLDTIDRSPGSPFDTYMDYLFYQKPFTPMLMKKARELILAHYRPEIEQLLKDSHSSMIQLQSRLLKIDCEVLVLNGQYDRFQSSDLLNDLHTYLPRAKRVDIANCGHVPYIENPTPTLRALENFLL